MKISTGTHMQSGVSFTHGKNQYLTTGRNMSEYMQFFPDLQVNSNDRVCEVGAGISEFIYYVLENGAHLPIVIDPMPYNDALSMMEEAALVWKHGSVRERLEHLMERTRIILDPSCVQLHQCTLEEYCSGNTALHEGVDTLVDAFASKHYSRYSPNQLQEMRQSLLQPEGKMFVR